MTLNHLNLTVPNAAETAAFFERYFGLRPMEGAKNSAAFALLRDDAGIVLTLIRAKQGTEVRYPDTFHVGFIQPTEEAVNEINARLREDGYDVPDPARMHGSWTFYFTCPGGFMVEVLS